MDDDLNTRTGHSGLSEEFDASGKSIVTVDTERYESYLDGSNMSAAQKEKCLQALWTVILGFVELGFGRHPLQEVCGKDAAISTEAAKILDGKVYSKEPKKISDNKELSP